MASRRVGGGENQKGEICLDRQAQELPATSAFIFSAQSLHIR